MAIDDGGEKEDERDPGTMGGAEGKLRRLVDGDMANPPPPPPPPLAIPEGWNRSLETDERDSDRPWLPLLMLSEELDRVNVRGWGEVARMEDARTGESV